MFPIWAPVFIMLFLSSSYNAEAMVYNSCTYFETSVLPEKGLCACHPDNYTVCSQIANGRPKSAPAANWSCPFMRSPYFLMLVCVCLVVCPFSGFGYACSSYMFWAFLVICCGCCNGVLFETTSFLIINIWK